MRLHQHFKDSVIALLPRDGCHLAIRDVIDWLYEFYAGETGHGPVCGVCGSGMIKRTGTNWHCPVEHGVRSAPLMRIAHNFLPRRTIEAMIECRHEYVATRQTDNGEQDYGAECSTEVIAEFTIDKYGKPRLEQIDFECEHALELDPSELASMFYRLKEEIGRQAEAAFLDRADPAPALMGVEDARALLLDSEPELPTEAMINDWNIHNDHAGDGGDRG